VGHADHGHARLGQVDHDVQHLFAHFGIQRGRRFVKEHVWSADIRVTVTSCSALNRIHGEGRRESRAWSHGSRRQVSIAERFADVPVWLVGDRALQGPATYGGELRCNARPNFAGGARGDSR